MDTSQMEVIASMASRNEKISWDRKMDNMVKLIASIRPIEDSIMELMITKQPILDDISNLRTEMVTTCVHPADQLVVNTCDPTNEYVECKFCLKRMKVVGNQIDHIQV